MKNSEINIDTIRNMDNTTKHFIDMARLMTDKEKDILLSVMELAAGRPDRQQYALNYTGKVEDLPAVLAQI